MEKLNEAQTYGINTCVPDGSVELDCLKLSGQRIRVLVVMRSTDRDRYTHGHPTSATTPLLCKFLLDAGFEVELVNNLERLKRADDIEGLNYFDAVVFHGKIEQADPEAVNALKAFVDGGKGLVVIHIASASFAPDRPGQPPIPSDDWRNLIGSVFLYGTSDHPRPSEIAVRIADTEHQITAGIPAEFRLQEDELYQNMSIGAGGAGCPIAYGTTLDNHGQPVTEPVAFTLDRGEGRVFHMYLGHFISTHRDWRFQQMITQGVEWAAGF